MKNRSLNVGGLLLIAIGGLALLDTILGPLFEFSIWRLWPVSVMALGLGLVVTPLLFLHKRGLTHMFIPGFPVLVTGLLLFVSSTFNIWGLWASSWPLLVLGLAFGFFATAIMARNIWLLIPAIIIGTNGLIFQFCALTGLWEAWSVLWTLEPLSVGVALILTSGGRRGMIVAGLIVSAVAVALFSMMGMLLTSWMGTVGAILLIVAGGALIRNGRPSPLLPEKAPKEKLADGAL
jgi:hypothetical protein